MVLQLFAACVVLQLAATNADPMSAPAGKSIRYVQLGSGDTVGGQEWYREGHGGGYEIGNGFGAGDEDGRGGGYEYGFSATDVVVSTLTAKVSTTHVAIDNSAAPTGRGAANKRQLPTAPHIPVLPTRSETGAVISSRVDALLATSTSLFTFTFDPTTTDVASSVLATPTSPPSSSTSAEAPTTFTLASDPAREKSDTFSNAALAGVVVGTVAALVLIVAIVRWILRQLRRRKEKKASQEVGAGDIESTHSNRVDNTAVPDHTADTQQWLNTKDDDADSIRPPSTMRPVKSLPRLTDPSSSQDSLSRFRDHLNDSNVSISELGSPSSAFSITPCPPQRYTPVTPSRVPFTPTPLRSGSSAPKASSEATVEINRSATRMESFDRPATPPVSPLPSNTLSPTRRSFIPSPIQDARTPSPSPYTPSIYKLCPPSSVVKPPEGTMPPSLPQEYSTAALYPGLQREGDSDLPPWAFMSVKEQAEDGTKTPKRVSYYADDCRSQKGKKD